MPESIHPVLEPTVSTLIWTQFPKSETQPEPVSLASHRFGAAFCGSEFIPSTVGTGERDYFSFPGIFLFGIYQNFQLHNDFSASIAGEDYLKFHFKLSGNNTVQFDRSDAVNLRAGSMAIAIHPRDVLKLDAHLHGASERSLTFACRPTLFTETLRLDPESLPQPIRDFAIGRDPRPHLELMALSARVTKTVEDMLCCPYSDRFSHIHAEARALDLICMVLDVFSNRASESSVRLTPRDVSVLESLREHLGACFADPPTIAQLARTAGINRTKLTQGFRYLFNETILDYCHRMRMQKARQMLLQGIPVGNVAMEVGYEHHSSFAQAFRRYFGFPPVELCSRRPRT